MAFEFKFPDIGEGITKGTIIKWEVKEGDKVKEDDTLAQVETDKAVADIPSPKTGIIEKIMIPAGKDVAVGQTLVTIAVEGEPSSGTAPESTETTASQQSNLSKSDKGTGAVGELESAKAGSKNLFSPQSKTAITPVQSISKPISNLPSSVQNKTGGLALPGTRQEAKKLGVDISQVRGTGLHGQVTQADLQRGTTTPIPANLASLKLTTPSGDIIEITGSIQAIKMTASQNQEPIQALADAKQKEQVIDKEKPDTIKEKPKATVKRKYDSYGYIDRKPLSPLRKIIATNMRKSIDTATHVTAMDEIDVTDLWKLQKVEAKKAEKKKIKLTFLPYITRACIQALRKVPALNSTLDEENEELILKKYYNIGQAVATEAGLMVVVVKRAEQKTLYLIAKDIQELAQKARDRKIDISDLKGSSFTITNWGSVGGSYGTPIINPGESAILGVGRIRPVPYLIGKKVEPRYLLPVSLTFDHRVTDGAEAAIFLQELKAQLESPRGLINKEFLKGIKKEEIFDV